MANAEITNPGVHAELVTAPGEDSLLGKTLDGRFRVVELIGVGGMGRVYRAVQARLNRPVALKVLNKAYGHASDASFRKRFFLEASLTAQLRHPNVVTVIDYGVTRQGVFYIAMEYLEGETLIDLLSRTPCLPWRRALAIGQQVARGVREAHRLGVVHRDLKPGNVMLLSAATDHDLVKVLDFGLVKSFVQKGSPERSITQHGTLMGSPQYMAPEQAEKCHADPRSDVYSLGVVLYELMVGRPPFVGRHHVDVILKHVNDPVPAMQPLLPGLSVPEPVEDLIRWCLKKDPAKRPQSMDEVLEAMQGILSPRSTSVERAASRPRRSWFAGLVPSVSFLAAAAIGVTAAALVAPRLRAQLFPPEETPMAAPGERPGAAPAPMSGMERIHFRVESVPPGAQVKLKGKSVGLTPLVFDLPPGPDGTARAELELALEGHLPLSVVAGGSGPKVELVQHLQPVPLTVTVPVPAPVVAVPAEAPRPRPVAAAAPARKGSRVEKHAKRGRVKEKAALKPLPAAAEASSPAPAPEPVAEPPAAAAEEAKAEPATAPVPAEPEPAAPEPAAAPGP